MQRIHGKFLKLCVFSGNNIKISQYPRNGKSLGITPPINDTFLYLFCSLQVPSATCIASTFDSTRGVPFLFFWLIQQID